MSADPAPAATAPAPLWGGERETAEDPGPCRPTCAVAVRTELARALQPPFETFITVAVNGALMSSAWFFLPPKLKDDVFTLHGTLAFALVLAAWMYSDVPAHQRARLRRPPGVGGDRRPGDVAPAAARQARRAVAAGDPGLHHRGRGERAPLHPRRAGHLLLGGLASPWCPSGCSASPGLFGDRFPYHPMPIRYRWAHRRPVGRMLVRWGILVVTPYMLVPFLGVALMTPSLLLWGFTGSTGSPASCPTTTWGWAWPWPASSPRPAPSSAAGGLWLARRRRAKLLAYLADPTRG